MQTIAGSSYVTNIDVSSAKVEFLVIGYRRITCLDEMSDGGTLPKCI
jgi:hypothetical protein